MSKKITLLSMLALIIAVISQGCGIEHQNVTGVISVADHQAPLSSQGDDQLFTVELVDLSDPDYAFYVDTLTVHFKSLNWISTVSLVQDVNQDGLFGVGDILKVNEVTFSNMYQVNKDQSGLVDVFNLEAQGEEFSFSLIAWDYPVESHQIFEGHTIAEGQWLAD